MKKVIIILVLFIFHFSCNKKETKVVNEVVNQKITIDTFTFENVPDGFDGAGCYYSDIKNNEYIFIHDYVTTLMKINGQFEKFKLERWDSLPENKAIYKYKNEKYDLEVITKDSLQIDYNTIITGKLKLKSKDNQIIEKKFTGECGC